jgi:large subunit ribosomal protein L15
VRLEELAPEPKSRKRRKRVGRGIGSGHGKTSCKGHKGQKARSGGGTKAGFEGGQMPLQRRLPKRGFTNIFQKQFNVVNIDVINSLTESIITPDVLKSVGVVKNTKKMIKILGKGELTRPVTVNAHAFSASAKEKIIKAQGSVEII